MARENKRTEKDSVADHAGKFLREERLSPLPNGFHKKVMERVARYPAPTAAPRLSPRAYWAWGLKLAAVVLVLGYLLVRFISSGEKVVPVEEKNTVLVRFVYPGLKVERVQIAGEFTKWRKVDLERENGKVGIYLLDRSNNVLSYNTLNDEQLSATGTEAPVIAGSLDDQPEYAGRIYPADRFFMALASLSAEIQEGVLAHPGAVLAAEGTPVRVGISDEAVADMIRIGIELDTPQGLMILVGLGQEWAVWQLRTQLEPRLSGPASGARRWPQSRVEP